MLGLHFEAFPPLNDVVETQNFTPASAGGDGNEGGMADDSGNSHAIENSEEGMVNGDDDGSDNPQEMVVLDPNHVIVLTDCPTVVCVCVCPDGKARLWCMPGWKG